MLYTAILSWGLSKRCLAIPMVDILDIVIFPAVFRECLTILLLFCATDAVVHHCLGAKISDRRKSISTRMCELRQ